MNSFGIHLVVFVIIGLGMTGSWAAPNSKYPLPTPRHYNGPYEGANLNKIAFPIGGIGAGMFCLEGTGAISHMSVRNRMEFFNAPCTFAAICVKGEPNVARVLEGPIPDWKYFGAPGTANGATGTSYGFPRFREAVFNARFPFAEITLHDDALPLKTTITGWSPFTPGEPDDSSLPVGALEYTFWNTSDKAIEAVFSFNTKNFMSVNKGMSGIREFKNGFALWQGKGGGKENEGAFAIYVDSDDVVVDHCWFKGGWWDSMTLAWRNIEEAILMDNPPVTGNSPGASLFVPFSLKAGETRTIRLMTAWYVPKTNIRLGTVNTDTNAFENGPSKGTAEGQQEVTGFVGSRLVNTFDPDGDGPTGTLTSKEFTIKDRYIHFLIAGGSQPNTRVELLVEGKTKNKVSGDNTENLKWASWDVSALKGKKAQIRIVDEASGGWGHVCLDHIVFSAKPIIELRNTDNNELKSYDSLTVFEDFESLSFKEWEDNAKKTAESSGSACCSTATCCPDAARECETPSEYVPWYAARFEDLEEVAAYWRDNYATLRASTSKFSDTFYDTSLPPEVIEAIAANLTILKTPTVLRQTDGRLWCFEGCCDTHGCCHGSCTHVWNYAQAIPHLFPSLERTLRWTEFHESQDEQGHQTFRSNLPITPTTHGFHAASDGQLGGIMKVYREWRISGDTKWLKLMWPLVKQSLEYCITTWDPRGRGILEEPHHNTYDIEYWGPDGHCSSFYLGALAAATRMGTAMGDDVSRYQDLLKKGREYLETNLYDGEYFFQIIQTEGLDAEFKPLPEAGNGPGYADMVALINKQGPKYQYGTGCLSDGVLGFWIANVCGIEDNLVDPAKVKSHLSAVHKYNLKEDLSAHANPQRPTFAMGNDGGLLLCTWPKGGALAIPFVYSNEVWTGIEYQVAAHLMTQGLVEEGLEIVRICRDRYDGVRRNPFDEYECGHWYARALSSYGMLQGLTGVRYDAVDKTLYIDSKVGDFHSFLCTAHGYGTVSLKGDHPSLDVKHGEIDVKRCVVSGKEVKLD